MADSKNLIEIEHLKKYFDVRGTFGHKNVVRAVDDVTLNIRRGETMGLVGESGCGKSTLGRTITRLYDVTSGSIRFDGVDIANLSGKALSKYKRRMQTIFQDPYSSLNPYMNVEQIIGESLDLQEKLPTAQRRERITDMLSLVGLSEESLSKYPHEFSGGQRQRVGIARALIVKPDFVLCDEPISALDVSIQAQVVNMLEDLQQEMGLTYLFVAHDLSMVRHISNWVGVMYMGVIVELAPSRELYTKPEHPYTKALLSAIPIPDPHLAQASQRVHLQGDLPSPMQRIEGCAFASRCPLATAACREARPELKEIAPDHYAACRAISEQ